MVIHYIVSINIQQEIFTVCIQTLITLKLKLVQTSESSKIALHNYHQNSKSIKFWPPTQNDPQILVIRAYGFMRTLFEGGYY